MSTAAEEEKDYVKAYEVLADLTPSQKKMVADRLDALKERYVQAASQRREGPGTNQYFPLREWPMR